MPRYDDRDRYGGGNSARLYVGHLSSRTRSRDLDDVFSRYGRVRDVDLKHDFAFIEFSDPRDADDARYHLNGRNIDGSRIVVEFAKGGPRGGGGSGGDRYLGKGPPPGSGRCFNCGLDGHWARDCKAGDWKNKCYRCGERGHIERSCPNSPKSLKRGRSYSRSPSRSRSRSPPPRRGRSRSRSLSRSRSYNSRSRSPRRDRSVERSRSPPPSKERKRSPTPVGESPREGGSPISKGKSRSPSPEKERYPSPSEANGRSPSASPRATDRSPMEDDGGRGGSGSPSSAQE